MSKIIVSDTSCLILLDKLNLLSLGPLIEAEHAGLIPLIKPILAQIKMTDFRISENLERQVLALAGE